MFCMRARIFFSYSYFNRTNEKEGKNPHGKSDTRERAIVKM